MRGLWYMTWHETGAISPGVPDLSYVMRGGGFETGWLELKGVDGVVEQSQHDWMANHATLIPVHFLVIDKLNWWLIPGVFHKELFKRRPDELAYDHGDRGPTMREKLSLVLKHVTRRR